ncbi:MAG: hypothetical protein WA154_05115 [Moraxellaceae bacterium]
MKARPILFNAPMVRALLDDRKTQTRRIIKPPGKWGAQFPICAPGLMAADHQVWWHGEETEKVGVAADCPYGAPGDLLIVRETFLLPNTVGGLKPREVHPSEGVHYVADGEPHGDVWDRKCPAIHMPRWASRLTLEITDVRVERLQDISEADAIAEGLYKSFPDDEDRAWFDAHYEDEGRKPTPEEWAQFEEGVWMVPGVPQGWGMTKAERRRDTWGPTPQFCYRLLWEHINGPDSWAANPWVWAVSSKVHRANVDQLLAAAPRPEAA